MVDATSLLTAIVQSSEDAIFSNDLNGTVLSWNDAAERIFGYRAAEIIGHPVSVITPPELNEENAILERLKRGEKVYHYETIRLSKDQRPIDVYLCVSPLKDPQGEMIGVSKIARDITEHKRAAFDVTERKKHQEALVRAVADRTARLEQTIEELQGISYSLSHDLRTPLRTIQSFSQIILTEARDRLSSEQIELLEKTIGAAGRMDRLIRDCLDFNCISRARFQIGAVDVGKLIRQIVNERPEFQQPRAVIEIIGSLEPVEGHEAYLAQCITNILDNALKFMDPARTPQVRIWNEVFERYVRLWFEDNGIGIPEDARLRIFGIFQRVHSEKEYPGTGIGLAIARKAVERMGGRIGVESELEVGSRFWIELARSRT